MIIINPGTVEVNPFPENIVVREFQFEGQDYKGDIICASVMAMEWAIIRLQDEIAAVKKYNPSSFGT